MTSPPSRRTLFAHTAAAAALVALAGCADSDDDPPASETAAAIVLRQLLAAEEALVTHYQVSVTGTPGELAADHEAHAAALRERLRGGSSSASAPEPLSGELVTVERTAAVHAASLPGKKTVMGDVVALCASIAACEYSHVAALGGDVDTKPDAALTLDRAAISTANATVAGLYAADYGYGIAGAHLTADEQGVAQRIQQRHRERRSTLASAINAAGGTPPLPQPAYELPMSVTDGASAIELLVALEESVGRLWRALLVVVSATHREQPLLALADSACSSALWRRSTTHEFPDTTAYGTAAFPGA